MIFVAVAVIKGLSKIVNLLRIFFVGKQSLHCQLYCVSNLQYNLTPKEAKSVVELTSLKSRDANHLRFASPIRVLFIL